MGSTPSMTTGVPSGPQGTQSPVPKPPFALDRLAAWILPLAAVCLLLGALGMAIRSGEMRWGTAGITMYAVCVAMWVTVPVLRRTSLAAPPTFQTEFQRFAGFANSLFPWLALSALTGTSFVAAIMNQQKWVTTGIVCLSGWCLVWMGYVVLPSLQRSKSSSYGTQESAIPTIDRFLHVGLLLLSFVIVGAALRFGVNPGRMKWLTISMVALVGYFAVLARLLGAYGQTAVGFSLTVLQGVLLVTLASGVAVTVYLHRLNWIAGSVIGYVGCLAVWLYEILRSLPKPTPPAPDAAPQYRAPSGVPVLLTAALLASLGLALYLREISALKAALLAILGGLSLWFAWLFISSVESEGPPQIDTNWGGLGGGLGGWRCSASLVYGLCALTLTICTGFTFLEVQRPPASTVGTSTSAKSIESNRQSEGKNDGTSVQPSAATAASTKKDQTAAKPETK